MALPPAVPQAEHQLRSRTEQVRRLEGELEGRGVLMKDLQRRLHRAEAEAREAQRKVTNDRNFVGVLNFCVQRLLCIPKRPCTVDAENWLV